MSERDEFEAWHNRFYGPQDKYNPIRSLEHDSCGVGLGYDDPTVQAQFVAFCGALASRAQQAEPVAWIAEHDNNELDFVNFYEDKAREQATESGGRVRPLIYGDAAPAPTQGTQEPVGWKLVPVHPTPEMRAAGAKINGQGWDFAHHTWRTMLLHAPASTGSSTGCPCPVSCDAIRQCYGSCKRPTNKGDA